MMHGRKNIKSSLVISQILASKKKKKKKKIFLADGPTLCTERSKSRELYSLL